MILYAPRRVTLPPNQPQAIRLSARAPEGPARRRISRAHAVPRHSAAAAGRPRRRRSRASPSSCARSTASPSRSSSASAISRPRRRSPTSARSTDDGKPAMALDISRSGDRSTFGEVRVFKAGRRQIRSPWSAGDRRLHRDRPALGDHPDRSGPCRQRHRPGDGAICRADRHRAGDHRRNQRGPALGRQARSGALDRCSGPPAGCAAPSRSRRWPWPAPLPHGPRLRSARPGPPIPKSSSCSTSTSASCGWATAFAPIRRPKAPASCSATS